MIEIFWDLYQQKQISDVKFDASHAKDEVGRQADRVRELEFAVQRSALVNQALWELLRSRFDLEEADLLAKVKEIDLRDGKLDGRMSAQTQTCPTCDRVLSAKYTRCIYCGTDIHKRHVFQ